MEKNKRPLQGFSPQRAPVLAHCPSGLTALSWCMQTVQMRAGMPAPQCLVCRPPLCSPRVALSRCSLPCAAPGPFLLLKGGAPQVTPMLQEPARGWGDGQTFLSNFYAMLVKQSEVRLTVGQPTTGKPPQKWRISACSISVLPVSSPPHCCQCRTSVQNVPFPWNTLHLSSPLTCQKQTALGFLASRSTCLLPTYIKKIPIYIPPHDELTQ